MRTGRDTMTRVLATGTGLAFVATLLSRRPDIIAYAGGFIPARVTQPDLLSHAGAGVWIAPMWLTPWSATFIHAGWMHVGFNLVTLLFCARQVEVVTGPWLMLLLYMVGAYAAAMGHYILDPGGVVPMIGASGAISAVIGAYALLYSDQKVRPIGPVPAHVVRMVWFGAGWIFVQSLIALAGAGGAGGFANIAIGAHIGGFVAGMVLTRPLLRLRFGGRGR